ASRSSGGSGPGGGGPVTRRGRRDHLIESLVGADHAEIAAGKLIDGGGAGLQVGNLRLETAVALGERGVERLLRRDGVLETLDTAYAVVGNPDPVLQQDQGNEKGCG